MGDWASSSHLGQGGKGVAYWQAGHFQGAGVPWPTCSPRLTPGQTSPRSSRNSFHHSRHCLNLQSRPTASSWAAPTHSLLPKGRPGNPLSKHNLPPLLPKNVAYVVRLCPALVADCALGSSGTEMPGPVPRKGRRGEDQVGRGGGGGGGCAHTGASGQPSSSLHPTLPNCPLHTWLANVQPVQVLLTSFGGCSPKYTCDMSCRQKSRLPYKKLTFCPK